jgi:hypothetical protein
MTQPTTQGGKYSDGTDIFPMRQEIDRIHAERVESDLARQKELLQAAVNMANHWLAQRTELMGRINRARQIGHAALNDVEGGHVEALAGAVQDMIVELEGDR